MQHFSQCHAAFLESNYDEQMLENGKYPIYLKRRIRGGKGHLSNRQALQLFTSCKPSYMSHLLLSHLSQENNCPKLVKELFSAHAQETEIVVASRFYETPVYTISHPAAGIDKVIRAHTMATQLQLPL
jgi:phosphoribosyl 1,2-cyclic phosphodiesterase